MNPSDRGRDRSGALPLVLVVAIARNGAIGVAGGLPWRLKSDLRRFRAVTMGKPIVMGRKTFESIGKPLDGRENIVISRRRDFAPAGVTVVRNLDEALQAAEISARETGAPEICIIGGGEVFAETMPLAERLLITHVEAEPAADVFFPQIGPEWAEVSRETLPRSEGDTADAVFSTYARRGTA